ncbi:T9SS type A sorting domain-containing protein [Pedobacter helvus]|uniref:T9SS type A sorting domain-containing protein n=1 Tax=Pedobacter helvus TaxID=2563444 RepID=A0ABW9JG04_9SPHI|nr:T9SS type A sorting domain-containing protein [Pedobacter ureilyticus]
MRKILLISSFCALAFGATAQFTPNRLAVYRVGDGTTITNNRTSAVFIDEYLTSSTAQVSPSYTIAVASASSGPNLRLTSIMRSSASAFQLEGISSLSADGQHLAIIGYDQAIGGTVDNTTIKVVGLINAQGEINTSTSLTGNSPARATIAINGGNSTYSSLLGAGIRYSAIGSTVSTQVNSTVSNARSFTIFNNRLYCANNSNLVPFFNGLPSSTGTSTAGNINLSGISNVNQIALFDADGDGTADILYAANDGASLADAGLHKYILEGGDWIARGFIKIAGITDGLKSVVGKATGSDIELYVTTWGNLASTPKVPSQLLKIIDLSAGASIMNNTDNAPTVLATATDNTIFRSVTFSPGTTPQTTLPVKLISFNGTKKQNGINLRWTTASEVSNSHFEVLRATNGNDFAKIGEVKGNGNSTSNQSYSFLDQRPQNGVNYYQLKQVDLNGDSEKFKIIAIDFNLQQNQLKVWQLDSQTLKLSFTASHNGNAEITVADINGKKLYRGKSAIAGGINNISLPLQVSNGLYLININTGKEIFNSKFLR